MGRPRSSLALALLASGLAACAPSARPAPVLVHPETSVGEAAPARSVSSPAHLRWRAEVEGGAVQIAAYRGALAVVTQSGRLAVLDRQGQPVDIGLAYRDLTAVAAGDGALILGRASGRTIRVVSEDEISLASHVESASSPSAVANGYGPTTFTSIGDVLIRAGDGGEFTTFLEGLGPLTSLVANGGALLAASGRGALSISLTDASVTPLEESSPGAHSVTLDHQGLPLASVVGRGLLRYEPEGVVRRIEVPGAGELGALSFDAESRTLFAVDRDDGGAVLALDYLALLGDAPGPWAAREGRPMRVYRTRRARHDIEVSGAEYWPNRGEAEADYPADILWGFYPEEGLVFEGAPGVATATPAAVACAERSYAALIAFIDELPPAFLAALGPGVSSRFYLWVNDYSEAAPTFSHEVRPARFWYWARNPAVVGRVPGYWKWETTLTRDGVCHIPERAQIDAYLAERS